MIEEVARLIEPGNSVYLDGRLCHIRALVDGWQVVYRTWSRRKRDYYYHVESRYWFELAYQSGNLRKARKRKMNDCSLEGQGG